jgi:hypothetical protein
VVNIPAHALLAIVNTGTHKIEIWDSSRHPLAAKVNERITEIIRSLTPQFAEYAMDDPLKNSSPLGRMHLNASTMCMASVPFMLMVRFMNFPHPAERVAHYLDSKIAFDHFLSYTAYARDLWFMSGSDFTRKVFDTCKISTERKFAQYMLMRFPMVLQGPSDEYKTLLSRLNLNGPLQATKLTFERYGMRAKNHPSLNEAAKLTPGTEFLPI